VEVVAEAEVALALAAVVAVLVLEVAEVVAEVAASALRLLDKRVCRKAGHL
jgi:hypothetical protein